MAGGRVSRSNMMDLMLSLSKREVIEACHEFPSPKSLVEGIDLVQALGSA